jgi:hypothetical protein
MDQKTILIGTIILLVCLVPVSLLKLKVILAKRKKLRILNNLAEKNNTLLMDYEHWNDSAIGLTEKGQMLFVINNVKENEQGHVINLSLFSKCRVVNNNTGSPFKEGNFKVSDGIDLELTGPGNLSERINFYNTERDGDLLTDELSLAEKWNRIINGSIIQQVLHAKA